MDNLDKLLERACAGDSEAWTAVYKDGIVQRITTANVINLKIPLHLSEDISQNVFAGILNASKSGKGYNPNESSPQVYINEIAKRKCIDFIRKNSRRIRTVEQIEDYDPPYNDAQESIDAREELKEVLEKIKGDSYLERGLNLIFLNQDGYKTADLSQAFGIPEGTVKTHMTRTRTKLRHRFQM